MYCRPTIVVRPTGFVIRLPLALLRQLFFSHATPSAPVNYVVALKHRPFDGHYDGVREVDIFWPQAWNTSLFFTVKPMASD